MNACLACLLLGVQSNTGNKYACAHFHLLEPDFSSGVEAYGEEEEDDEVKIRRRESSDGGSKRH